MLCTVVKLRGVREETIDHLEWETRTVPHNMIFCKTVSATLLFSLSIPITTKHAFIFVQYMYVQGDQPERAKPLH